MKKIRHLLAETVIFVSLAKHQRMTMGEIRTWLNDFNSIGPSSHDRVKVWLEGKKLFEDSQTLSDDDLEIVDDVLTEVAVLYCTLEHYLRVRVCLGHVECKRGLYSVTQKGVVYFDHIRKELEARRSLPHHMIIRD